MVCRGEELPLDYISQLPLFFLETKIPIPEMLTLATALLACGEQVQIIRCHAQDALTVVARPRALWNLKSIDPS